MKFYTRMVLVLSLLALISCRSEFERIRVSGDATRMYEEANSLFEKGEYRKAITLYELIIPAYRGKAEAEQLYYNYANAHFLDRRYILSSHYFKTFADTYTSSPRREQALYNSAYSHYKLSPKFKLDQANTSKAIDAFQLFVNAFPESDKVSFCNTYIDELRSKMEEKAYDIGRLYYNMRNFSSAIQSFENMLKDYPGSGKEEEVMYYLIKASLDLAENSIYTKQEERYTEAIERCLAYLKKHPDSERSSEVVNYRNNSQKALNKISNG